VQTQFVKAQRLKLPHRPIGFVAYRHVGGKFSVSNPHRGAQDALLSAKKSFDAARAHARNPTRGSASAFIAYEFHMGNIGVGPTFR
jgi:hypothetical protein